MVMNSVEKFALDVTRDIVVAKTQNSTMSVNKPGGISAGEFFEEIYKKVLERAKGAEID